jgi:hypothetical protein
MLSQSEAPDYSAKELLESVMTPPLCSVELLNDPVSDTTDIDSSKFAGQIIINNFKELIILQQFSLFRELPHHYE